MGDKKIIGGAVQWAKATLDSEIYLHKPAVWFKIWFYLVLSVQWKDTRWYKRGSGYFTYDKIHQSTKATKHQIKHCIEWLKYATQIATQKKQRGMVITIVNYNKYQLIPDYWNTEEGRQKGKQKENKRNTHTSNTINTGNTREERADTISFNYKEGKFSGITSEYIKELKESFSRIDVIGELKKMRNWLLDNPNKKRQGKRTFITNWLTKANNESKSSGGGLQALPQGGEHYRK